LSRRLDRFDLRQSRSGRNNNRDARQLVFHARKTNGMSLCISTVAETPRLSDGRKSSLILRSHTCSASLMLATIPCG
jgi:hypothetical protein